MGLVLLGTFVGGVFASNPPTQLLNVFVTNFPANQNVTVSNFPKNATSHLGQSITNHVMLGCFLRPPLLPCNRFFSNGTLGVPFNIPAGSELVVTDVQWSAVSTRAPGMTEFLAIDLIGCCEVFFSVAIVSADGMAFSSEHMIAGIVVSST